MAENEHGRIIADQARMILQPAGFRRKGRSRVWIADRGFWLSIVEFQPSSWSRGTYLNLAIHWLWGSLPGTLTFDRPERIGKFLEFQTPSQFQPLVAQMAAKAVEIEQNHQSTFASIDATAAFLVSELRSGDHGVWASFHAGVAAGLAGDYPTAKRLLESVRAPAISRAKSLLAIIDSPLQFRSHVKEMIETERTHFKLGSLLAQVGI